MEFKPISTNIYSQYTKEANINQREIKKSVKYLRCELDLLIMFSRNVFCGATNPLRPPGIVMNFLLQFQSSNLFETHIQGSIINYSHFQQSTDRINEIKIHDTKKIKLFILFCFLLVLSLLVVGIVLIISLILHEIIFIMSSFFVVYLCLIKDMNTIYIFVTLFCIKRQSTKSTELAKTLTLFVIKF